MSIILYPKMRHLMKQLNIYADNIIIYVKIIFIANKFKKYAQDILINYRFNFNIFLTSSTSCI